VDEGTVRRKQELAEMGENTTYRALSPEKIPLQNGINQQSKLLNEPERS
jgi:hypothetical protein